MAISITKKVEKKGTFVSLISQKLEGNWKIQGHFGHDKFCKLQHWCKCPSSISTSKWVKFEKTWKSLWFFEKKIFSIFNRIFFGNQIEIQKSSGHFYAPICILSIYVKTFAFRITHEAKDSFESGCKIDFWWRHQNFDQLWTLISQK